MIIQGMMFLRLMPFFLFFTLQSLAGPTRIVSLDPSLTEILFAAGLGKHVVGVTSYCNYPQQVSDINKIGSYNQPKIEKILELKPSHILVLKSGRPELAKDKRLYKSKLIAFEGNQLSDYLASLKKLKSLYPEAKTDTLIDDYQRKLKKVSNLNINKSGLILIAENPLVLASKKSFISQALSKCGYRNLAEHKNAWPSLSREQILKLNAPYILRLQMEESIKWADPIIYKNTKTIDRVGDAYFRLGPRFLDKVIELCNNM